MNYEQRYKEALERAKDNYNAANSANINVNSFKNTLIHIFPELKESEDEKIKKQIISFLKEFECDHYRSLDFSSWIAWLEKQGEQKPVDKVESKFHEGDWVIDKQGIVHQISNVIENVTNHTYGYDIVGGGYFNDNTEGVRLWTIEDAKDGDVLVASDGSIFIYKNQRDNGVVHYVAVTPYNDLVINKNDYSWESKNACYPATKDEQTILFERIKEAGYEWDATKKQLKKL